MSSAGVKAILLAGAPRTAGGEEEELMLRATRAIVERPGALPVRVGVNTGRVFAGIVGTPTRRTYTFYGDAINTAARIMARAADGQLLAREDVLERARTTYATTPIEPFVAKGKTELVRASDVGTAVGEREQEAIGPFVGREHELDALLAALAPGRARARAPRARDRCAGPRQDAPAGRAVRAGGRAPSRCACSAPSPAPTTRTRPSARSCGARSSSLPTRRRSRSSGGCAPRSGRAPASSSRGCRCSASSSG